ncbi:hypothetical protein C8R43DRAFT_1080688 [Mycena crocata]|nr:hypothetical protein C8R43DRAFT_1080688 [Mycena crocata]
MVGVLPPREGLQLYKARVDPHLTAGCEVVLDTDLSLVAHLEKPQKHFLRRLLGLNPRSMLAILFTETGLLPIRYRRAILALGYAVYFAGIINEGDLTRAAFRESLKLCEATHSSWTSDLRWVLASLPSPVNFSARTLLTAEGVQGIIDLVVSSCESDLQRQISNLAKTQFLKTRLEKDSRGNLVTVTLRFRHYLRLVNAPHRIAYTRFLLSDHKLAVEELRHGNRVWRFVEREFRLCRFCRTGVEDESHALLVCTGHDLLPRLRANFLRDVFVLRPELRLSVTTVAAHDFLLTLIGDRELTSRLAKFVYDVLTVFEMKEVWVPQTHYLARNH